MSAKFAIFIFTHIVVFAFFIETLRRVEKRASEYQLKDTGQTLPFGLVRLRHIVILYIASYVAWVIISILLYFYFINPTSLPSLENLPMRGTKNVELNL